MNFTKMHGTGNDFVCINCFDQPVVDPAKLARATADRHTGIGSDGLILILPSSAATVRMEMYNGDGSRAQMCGNGLRCVAKFAYDHGLTRQTTLPIETDDGIKQAECTVVNGKVARVRLDMGRPRFKPDEIPVRLTGSAAIDVVTKVAGLSLKMTCVSMGNPHAVLFVDSLADIDLARHGPAMENHDLFPERVNAHFVQVEASDRVTMLTWERGNGRTRACGTGASAVCVAGAVTGRTQRRILATVEGGQLELEWRADDHVYKTGPAVEVFRGYWPDPA